ncbi:MAG: tRNA (adenosine(37)-N6)-threonylcarbamoyltransferase complex dimerization subunit type 1 TsaB [Candidatus Gastranaerophilaceae bacterium]|jgi:tRNA threonylcarbamoyl adenosine modification protein YeaZ
MKILTFDTSLDKTYISLCDENETISKIIENTEGKYHSAYLISTIAALLRKKSFTMQDISAVGVNIGPGSFTGIRACVTVARVMGQTLEIPVLGICSLEIIATLNNTGKNVACFIDARKNKAYFALYSSENEVLTEPKLVELEEAVEIVKNNDYFVVSDKKMQEFLNKYEITSQNFENSGVDFGKHLSKIVLKHIKNKDKKYLWNELKPLYIQPPPVTMKAAMPL